MHAAMLGSSSTSFTSTDADSLTHCYACLLLSQGGDGAIGYKELSKILKKTQTELAKREKEKK